MKKGDGEKCGGREGNFCSRLCDEAAEVFFWKNLKHFFILFLKLLLELVFGFFLGFFFYLNDCFCVRLLEFLELFVQFFKSGFVSVLCISPPEFSLPHACVSSSVILCCVVTPDFLSTFLESFLYFKLELESCCVFSPRFLGSYTASLYIFPVSPFLLSFYFPGLHGFFLDFIIKKCFCSPSLGE